MSTRAGMQPHFLPRGAGWKLPAACGGVCVLLQLAAWIAGGVSASRQGDAAGCLVLVGLNLGFQISHEGPFFGSFPKFGPFV